MQINIPDPSTQTFIFTSLLILVTLLAFKKDPNPHTLNTSHTNELKGLAILMVIFSHVGYFLDLNDKFLFPLSVAGGVGVNIFLFLSGFGLTTANLKKSYSILGFYQRRLQKIYLPMCLTLIIFFVLDFFILNKSYPANVLINSFLGFFPNAEIYDSVNSPLWYFSLILFYYLIFPILFIKKKPILSAVFVFLLSYLILHFNLLVNIVNSDVLKLYKLHDLAFPIGMTFAILQNSKFNITSLTQGVAPLLKYILIALLCLSISYTAIHSGVGEDVKYEQFISLITAISFIFIILLKNLQSKFIILLGIYSYEIYLIQWPLIYRYDYIYKFLPAGIATFIYLFIFTSISYILNKLVSQILKILDHPR